MSTHSPRPMTPQRAAAMEKLEAAARDFLRAQDYAGVMAEVMPSRNAVQDAIRALDALPPATGDTREWGTAVIFKPDGMVLSMGPGENLSDEKYKGFEYAKVSFPRNDLLPWLRLQDDLPDGIFKDMTPEQIEDAVKEWRNSHE